MNERAALHATSSKLGAVIEGLKAARTGKARERAFRALVVQLRSCDEQDARWMMTDGHRLRRPLDNRPLLDVRQLRSALTAVRLSQPLVFVAYCTDVAEYLTADQLKQATKIAIRSTPGRIDEKLEALAVHKGALGTLLNMQLLVNHTARRRLLGDMAAFALHFPHIENGSMVSYVYELAWRTDEKLFLEGYVVMMRALNMRDPHPLDQLLTNMLNRELNKRGWEYEGPANRYNRRVAPGHAAGVAHHPRRA